ncbi:MAG: hypothetical protein EBR70_05055, partial [Verrucomicrobia bacterium]|nr:hypothetical protein [Verrucomicrobiota bacterium]
MPKKPAPKKKTAAKPVAKPTPVKKPAPKVDAKAKTAVKVAPPAKAASAGKGKAPVKAPAPVAKGKPLAKTGKPVADVVKEPKQGKAKPAKGGKIPKVDHDTQKKLLETHRKDHHQEAATDAPPRPKLQFYTVAEVQAYLASRKKKGVKLNLWVPEEERKAREKAAAAARADDHRTHNVAAATIA